MQENPEEAGVLFPAPGGGGDNKILFRLHLLLNHRNKTINRKRDQ